jgi:hypothetical protein
MLSRLTLGQRCSEVGAVGAGCAGVCVIGMLPLGALRRYVLTYCAMTTQSANRVLDSFFASTVLRHVLAYTAVLGTDGTIGLTRSIRGASVSYVRPSQAVVTRFTSVWIYYTVTITRGLESLCCVTCCTVRTTCVRVPCCKTRSIHILSQRTRGAGDASLCGQR